MNQPAPPAAAPPAVTTPLPPWALPGAGAGRGRLSRAVPPRPAAVLRAAGDVETLVLTCWLAVLARCVGEPEVTTAIGDEDGRWESVTCRVADATWDALGARLLRAPAGSAPDWAVDVHGAAPCGEAGLLVRLDVDAGEVCVEHDTARVSQAAADRVLGYLWFALAAAADGPGEPVDLADMIGSEERHRQLVELCGPRVASGPDGFVPAFRARVAAHPDRSAVRHGEEVLTYGDLDRASDRLARHLVHHGAGPGRAVAVVSERHPHWVVAVLATLKAGGVYLPVRPDFPAARVEDQLGRAECDLALVDPAGAALMAAVAELGGWRGAVHAVEELLDREPPPAELTPPALGHPAYVYFTSGSTGRPKGAVCEHAGMINHLWAKVDDHDLGPSDVVAQTASQCFDISLWQVCAPLIVGGSVLVVDVDDQLDVGAFAALLERHRVTTAQIVPSYLEILLAHLEAGRVRLPGLRSLSATGEALKADLVRRWFAVVPSVRLVNAYGATEVSDDTMHEVLDGPPRRDLAVVTVGRPLRNMRVYVVDDGLRLMPEGARGEIVFAGVCVGSGYVNDPERTAEAFGSDPHYPGERLYRSGDLGRWLPEGRLEFLGRRDEQVKIRGLRVELGEIQASLLRVPGIEAAAVVPVGEGNAARLVGFYVSDHELASIDLHDLLSARLPHYMVPAHHVRLDELPLNDNGKTDKPRLKQIAAELTAGTAAFEPPHTETEQRLATVWAEVLGMVAGRVGRRDGFFDLGGTSLSAIHLLMRLDHRLSLADIMTAPVLADQAEVLDAAASAERAETPVLLDLHDAGPSRPVLLCLPDAAGNAINFQRLADAVSGRASVVAVELPGHDLARRDEALVALPALVERLVVEVAGRARDVPVWLWGQGAGAAAALLTAQGLAEAGAALAGVIVAWDDTLPDRGADGPGGATASLSDDEVSGLLRRREAYVEVDGATRDRLRFVARAYRHDWAGALDVLDGPAGDWAREVPLVEIAVGTAPAMLEGSGWPVVAHRLPDAHGDLARLCPERIVEVLAERLGRTVPTLA